VRGKKIAPQQVSPSSCEDEEDRRGLSRREVTEAVITVPAYFNDAQRQATKDAGRIAGLEVKRIINEPTAAALAYGWTRRKATARSRSMTWAAAPSTSRSSRSATAHQFEVKSTNGDTFLGGEDFDQRIIDYLADEFKKDQGIDLRKRRAGAAAPEGAAEKAKIELSSAQQTESTCPSSRPTPRARST
jgi:molecular chaperone DnaK